MNEPETTDLTPKPYELKLIFDPQKQSMSIKFESEDIKTWNFVIGLIEMARIEANFQREASMAMHAMQQQQAQRIIQSRLNGR